MSHNPADREKIRNIKYLSWLIAFSIISIILSDRIDYWMPEYAHMDQVKYREMAEAAPNINLEVDKPFSYRILAPWIAGISPFKVDVSFFILNIATLILLVIAFYYFIIYHSISNRIAFGLTSCFIFNRYFFQFYSWDYFQLCDTLSFLFLLLSLFFLFGNKWLKLACISLLGVLTKELALLVIPIGYVFLVRKKATRSEFVKFTFSIVPAIVVFVGFRLLLKVNSGDELIDQFLYGAGKFFLPEVLAKKFIIAFIPFGLIPIIFFKEVVLFIKQNSHLFVYFLAVVFVSFFGDYERLMTPSAPVYYCFIAFVIQKYLPEERSKSVLRNFLVVLIIMSFLSSFYHLWGLLQLPNRDISIISTVLLTLITAAAFVLIKYPNIRIAGWLGLNDK
ncbi:hypothetical protein ACFLS9_05515 [Bacteroidota bacterium]